MSGGLRYVIYGPGRARSPSARLTPGSMPSLHTPPFFMHATTNALPPEKNKGIKKGASSGKTLENQHLHLINHQATMG